MTNMAVRPALNPGPSFRRMAYPLQGVCLEPIFLFLSNNTDSDARGHYYYGA